MSFLSGRMAAIEGSYFREQSKTATKLLKEKLDPQKLASASDCPPPSTSTTASGHADTLPENLMHSLPTAPPGVSRPGPRKLPPSPVPEGSSLAVLSQSIMKRATKAGHGFTKPIRDDPLHLILPSVPPETTFGPKRWTMELNPGSQPVPSTANAARLEAEPVIDPPTQEEVREGMFAIAKAFGVASTIVFGGAAAGIGLLGYYLEWHSLEDVKTKSTAAMTPRIQAIREWCKPTQQWAYRKGEKWKMEKAERQALGLEFAQSLGVQTEPQAKNNRHQA